MPDFFMAVGIRSGQPAAYLKICALLVPKEMKLEHTNSVSSLSDEELDQAIAAIKATVPTANPKPLTATATRLILAADERSWRVDLFRLDGTVQVAGCAGSRDPGHSTPNQRAAAQSPEAIGVRQY